MVGCQLFCDIFCAYFHSYCIFAVVFGGGRRWPSVLALSSGRAVVAGDTVPVTSLCSGGETLDGEQIRFRRPPPVKHSFTGGEPSANVQNKNPLHRKCTVQRTYYY